MFDIGWSELLVIGVVALVVVGPKDLPVMFHALGRFTAKARSMAREFSRAMEDAAKETGVNDIAKDLKGITSTRSLGLDKVTQAAAKFEAWDPLKKSSPTVKEPAPAKPAAEAAAAKPAADTPSARSEAAADAADADPAPRTRKAPSKTARAAATEAPQAKPRAPKAKPASGEAPPKARKPRASKTGAGKSTE